MQDTDPGGFAARNVRFFRALAVAAAGGVILSLLVAFGTNTLDIEGYFNLSALTRALLLMALVLATILVLFLLRIGVIFDVERQVRGLFESEATRMDEARRGEQAEAREAREALRRELAEMRDAIRKEFNQRDQMYDGAMRASSQALKAAQDALARAEALSREPAYRTTIESLVQKVDGLVKDVQALRTADKVNSPLLKELQEKVVTLEKGQAKLNHRVDETLESVERRDMEQAAVRQTLDHELSGLKKRETLLLVKQKELEEANAQLASKARPAAPAAFAPGEEGHHVMGVEGIGPVYASRLNAAGIITVPQLLAADARQLAPRIDATPEVVQEWQATAQLMRVKGVTPQAAEALAKAGVTNARQLATQDPEELAVKVRERLRGRKGLEITPATVRHWIESAR